MGRIIKPMPSVSRRCDGSGVRCGGAAHYINLLFVFLYLLLSRESSFAAEVVGIFLGVLDLVVLFLTFLYGVTLNSTSYLTTSILSSSSRSRPSDERREERLPVRRALAFTGLFGPSGNAALGGHPPGLATSLELLSWAVGGMEANL